MAIKIWIIECDRCGKEINAMDKVFYETADDEQICEDCHEEN